MLKPIIDQNNMIIYVSEADMIGFIEDNSNLNWNSICELARDENIFNEEGRTCWTKATLESDYFKNNCSDFTKEWMLAFFEAHPFINKVMFVFDD